MMLTGLKYTLRHCGGISIAVCLLLSMASYNSDLIYHQYRHVSQTPWDTQDTISFNIDTIPATGDYQLSVALRTTAEIQYQQIFLAVDCSLPHYSTRDTVSIILTDSEGEMQSNGIRLYNYSTPLPRSLHLTRGQQAQVNITHLMRRTQLRGITDVGIKIGRED